MAAASLVLVGLGDPSDRVVLHSSNNVLVGSDHLIAKVSRDEAAAQRRAECRIMAHRTEHPYSPRARRRSESENSPWWYGRVSNYRPAVAPREAARALREVQAAWHDFDGPLPTLAERLEAVSQLSGSGVLGGVLDFASVRRLTDAVFSMAVEIARPRSGESQVLHGEPHDSNFLGERSRCVVIDFEAACRGPVDWDAAFFPDHVVAEVWPAADRTMLARWRVVVSPTVSIYCWRHLSVRGPDEFQLWHAQHHLARVVAGET